METKNPETILSCHCLQVGHGNKTVLANTTLSFDKGQFISLLGPNGAGKTTLLRTLSRHLPPLGGYVRLMGRLLESFKAIELAKIMAVVLTDRVSPPLFSVFEFTSIGRYPHTNFLGRLTEKDNFIIHTALEAVHADHLSDRFFSDLSDGERQKVLIARALTQEPEILLLDEPTVHLDLKHRMEVMTILRDLCHTRGITVVASLHDVDVAARVSDQVALIKDGRIHNFGPPETVLTGRSVSDLYDFSDAGFDRRLGSIEIKGTGKKGRAFVIGGMGSGSLVYRLLAKKGYNIATGLIPTNDLDYFVARSLGASIASRSPVPAESDQNTDLSEAEKMMNCCDFVIDTGLSKTSGNRENTALLKTAFRNGKTVFTLSKQETDLHECTNTASTQQIYCRDEGHLAEILGQYTALNTSEEQNKEWAV